MDIFDGLSALGGLCLFLFGMSIMAEALQRRAGGRLGGQLRRMTRSRWAGFFTGLAVTAAVQSSSAAMVMVVGFVNSGLLTLGQAVGVIIGTNVGTTVTPWLLSLGGLEGGGFPGRLLRPAGFVPLLSLWGIIAYLSRNGRRRDTGQALLGFATLMQGMELMSGSVAGLAQAEGFRRLFTAFTDPLLGLLAGAVLTVVGVILTPQILHWMGTPEDVIGNSVAYFRTYFLGSIAVVMYNVGASILQSVGNSRSPMKYLITASLINIVLDLLFIGVLGYGVAAAAFATIISQSVSAILAFSKLMRSKEAWAVSWRKVRFDGPMLHGVILQGLPSGIQNSVISLANVIVQANINSFGALAMAGCGSYSKVEGFAFLPVTCFSMALATFVSQNVGAGKPDRVRKGMRFGVICSITLAECVGVAVYLLAPWLIGAFSSEADVVAFGVRQAHTIALFYFLLAFSHCCAGILRGLGRPIVPMAVMLAVWCALRITYITVTLHFIHDIGVIFWAYPLTWSISSLMFLHYLRHCTIPRVGGGAPHDMKDV